MVLIYEKKRKLYHIHNFFLLKLPIEIHFHLNVNLFIVVFVFYLHCWRFWKSLKAILH